MMPDFKSFRWCQELSIFSSEKTKCLFYFQLNESLDQWPHLNELVQCYKADFVKDDCKYGRYESVALPSFQNQFFEGPDTDIETGNPSSLLLNACINFTCILEKFDILALCHRIAALQRKAFQAWRCYRRWYAKHLREANIWNRIICFIFKSGKGILPGFLYWIDLSFASQVFCCAGL